MDTSRFYPNNDINAPLDPFADLFTAKLYADASIAFDDTNPDDPGDDDAYQVEDLGLDQGWRYNVSLFSLFDTFI